MIWILRLGSHPRTAFYPFLFNLRGKPHAAAYYPFLLNLRAVMTNYLLDDAGNILTTDSGDPLTGN